MKSKSFRCPYRTMAPDRPRMYQPRSEDFKEAVVPGKQYQVSQSHVLAAKVSKGSPCRDRDQ